MKKPIKDTKPLKVLHTKIPMKTHHLLSEMAHRNDTTLKNMLIEAIKDLAVKYNINLDK